MGTRSLTHIKEDGKTLLTIYRQMDGYPTGMGKDLKYILEPLALANGIGLNKKVANGMGCVAAQIVAGLKKGPGSVYIYPVDSVDCGEEYTYTIEPDGESFTITVTGYDNRAVFRGLIQDFDPEAVEAAENAY